VSTYDPTTTPNGSLTVQLQYAPADGSVAPKTLAGPLPAIQPFAWHNGPIPATPRPTVNRLAGADRIGTSVAVADAAYNPSRAGTSKADVAVISRSDTFADALAGNALAAQKHGPLLLTGSAKLDPAVAHELSTVLAKGATVYVLGGPQALSGQVEAQLRALGLTPKRLAGTDRFETATKIAAEVSPHPHTVLVATAINFPDALAAGAAAATDPNGGVVLLSNDKTLPASTKAYLAGVNPATTAVYGVGGQGVAALKTLAGFAGHFTALAGADRYATALAIANNTTLFPATFPAPSAVGIATGQTWPDALSGGAFIGALHGPLLLTDNNNVLDPGNPTGWLVAHRLPLNQIDVFGGPKVVQDSLLPEFGNFAFGAGNYDIR
jgi:putative cell wall-binding protein